METSLILVQKASAKKKSTRERFKFRSIWVEYANTLPIDEAKSFCMAIISYALYKKPEPIPSSCENYFQSKVLPELQRDWRQWESSNVPVKM